MSDQTSRGPKGDKGDKGERGDRGDRGKATEGNIGERGRTGIPGNLGQVGDQGIEGVRGKTGDTGERGQRGKTGPRSKGQLLAYGLVVLAMAAGFFQLEMADKQSRDDRELLCTYAKSNRDAIRQTYLDVSQLGRALVGEGAATTPQQKMRLEQQFKAFEDQRLKEYPPFDSICDEGLK